MVKKLGVFRRGLAQFFHCGLKHIESHRAGLDRNPNRLQSDSRIEIKNLVASNGHDARAAPRLNPSQRGIHQEQGQFAAAKGLVHRQQPNLVKAVVEGERQPVPRQIFIH